MNHIVTPVQPSSGAVRGMIYALRGRYPFLDTLPIGRSVLGREIYALVIGGGRRRILYAAAFHGQEWITSLLLLKLCEDICAALRGDGCLDGMNFRRALAGRCLFLIPTVNPDGVEIALHGAKSAGGYEGAVRALGGDSPGVWQANACGVDLNRNFNAGWESARAAAIAAGITAPAARRYGGPRPESEPETKALVRFCHRMAFRHVLALHTQGEEIYWQYGDNTPDQARIMAEIMAAASGYAVAQPDPIASHGGFKDWFIRCFSRPGFTIECGKGVNPLPLSDFDTLYAQVREMLLLAALM